MTYRDPDNARLLRLAALAGIGALAALYWQQQRRTRPGWVDRLDTGDPALLAFELGGHVRRPQIRAMANSVLAAFGRFGIIDMLVLLPSFTGLTPAAALDLKAIKAELLSLGKVRRYAVVEPPAIAGAMIRFSDHFLPVEARTFPLHDLRKAHDWVKSGR